MDKPIGDVRLMAATNDAKQSQQQQNLLSEEIRTRTDQIGDGTATDPNCRATNPPTTAVQKRKWTREPEVMLPSKFRKRSNQRWVGGGAAVNVRDPLDLGSVKPDNPDDPNFSKPIEVLPTNVNDPLNLQNLPPPSIVVPPIALKDAQHRKRKRPKQTRDDVDEQQQQSNAEDESNLLEPKRYLSASTSGKIQEEKDYLKEREESAELAKVQEVPKPAEIHSTSAEAGDSGKDEAEARKGRKQMMAERYRYGNFNHYHLKRMPGGGGAHHGASISDSLLQEDARVGFFCPDWFQPDKAVLDIGCGSGHFAISLARAYQPQRVVGLDLDQHLVGAARKNIRHFCDKDTKIIGKFPASFGANFGPVSAPCTSSGPNFPGNIWFFCENYVLSSDADFDKVHEEFDLIFALACTKWVHLNWGDAGMKRFFHRVFRQLRTGGRFILETAPFKDYRKHCAKKGADRPPEEVIRNFELMHFHPDEFTAFLLNTIGFSHHEELDNPHSKALGISGRLQVFYKGQFMLGADDEGNFHHDKEDQR